MKVVEKFVSINGEGKRAGEPAVFIRFKGCNLSCSYCDTSWANSPECDYEELSPEQILEYILSTGIKNVTLTGGEPLLAEGIESLLSALLKNDNLRVEIETNGSVDLTTFASLRKSDINYNNMTLKPDTYSSANTNNNFFSDDNICCSNDVSVNDKSCNGNGIWIDNNDFSDSYNMYNRLTFTMDYKLPSSTCESKMLPENFALLCPDDTVKFVAGDLADLERAAQVIREYGLAGRCHVYFSPVFGKIDLQKMADFIVKNKLNDVRLQVQLHKIIWDPDIRGV